MKIKSQKHLPAGIRKRVIFFQITFLGETLGSRTVSMIESVDIQSKEPSPHMNNHDQANSQIRHSQISIEPSSNT